jgi:hypothetical protein
MTLIASHFDRNGIVLATDSNLTNDDGQFARTSRKNFELPHLRGGLGVTGFWSVNGYPMDNWMPRFIARPETYKDGSLSQFVCRLRNALQNDATPQEKKEGLLVHVAGYEVDKDLGFHPVHWTVTNVPGLHDDGEYKEPTDTFRHFEDFWDRDCKVKDSPSGFSSNDYDLWIYANGFAPGRIAYLNMRGHAQMLLNALWNTKGANWYFRAPKSLAESEKLTRLYMNLVNGLFEISDAPALIVGGEPQIIGIPLPTS